MSKTDLTIEDIFTSLDMWREERGLQHTVGNIAANIGEEIVEYLRAENDEQRVDALCDMSVFCINALNANDEEEVREDDLINILMRQSCLDKREDYIIDIGVQFSNLLKHTLLNSKLVMMCVYAKAQIEKLGFDFLIAMDETLKEIHSRTGAMNEATGKWEKFKTEEAMALWYKADYSKAKL